MVFPRLETSGEFNDFFSTIWSKNTTFDTTEIGEVRMTIK
jgi:hypothetical protein